MAKKPTSPQVATLERIRMGWPPNATETERPAQPLPIARFESFVVGANVQCHRVVVDGSQLGRTELFRVAPDGFARQV